MTEKELRSREEVPTEVLKIFTGFEPDSPQLENGTFRVKAIGDGLINHSYKVSRVKRPAIFLQRINRFVFPDPFAVQSNYLNLLDFAVTEKTGLDLPHPVYYQQGETLYRDTNGEYWRAFRFIEDGVSYSVAQTPAKARATAKSFARIPATFRDFNMDLLTEVIPGFHDLELRFEQFEESLRSGNPERLAMTGFITDDLLKRVSYLHFFRHIRASHEFPRRVMHHDAKISNILFHKKTGRVIGPVDFDTTMPGYFFSDLGDMIRSMAGNCDENQKNHETIAIRGKYYEAIMDGYYGMMGEQLSMPEKKHIHGAGLIMIYMQALRFLTDYHVNDIYYKTQYPGQNLHRATNQLFLLKALEEFLQKNYSFSLIT